MKKAGSSWLSFRRQEVVLVPTSWLSMTEGEAGFLWRLCWEGFPVAKIWFLHGSCEPSLPGGSSQFLIMLVPHICVTHSLLCASWGDLTDFSETRMILHSTACWVLSGLRAYWSLRTSDWLFGCKSARNVSWSCLLGTLAAKILKGLRQGFMYPTVALNLLGSQRWWLELFILLFLSRAKMTSISLVYTVLGIEPRALCMLGEHTAYWATSSD